MYTEDSPPTLFQTKQDRKLRATIPFINHNRVHVITKCSMCCDYGFCRLYQNDSKYLINTLVMIAFQDYSIMMYLVTQQRKLALWCNQLSRGWQHWHLGQMACRFVSYFYHFQSSSLIMCLVEGDQMLRPLTPMWKIQMAFCANFFGLDIGLDIGPFGD